MKLGTRWSVAVFAFLLACGGGGGDANNGESSTNNGVELEPSECEVDDDCPKTGSLEGWAPFLHPENLVCAEDVNMRGYCSECFFDADCGEGESCRDRTYCEALEPCQTTADCGEEGAVVHGACKDGYCTRCLDDFDCNEGEVCYNLECWAGDAIDPSCIEASCGEADDRRCEVLEDDDGNPQSVACQ